MDFIGLVTWSRVRGLWKKGSERLKECLRVILSKNIEILACTFIHFNFLGWVILHLSYTLFLIALLRLPCKIWRSFVSFCFAHLWRFAFCFFSFLTTLLPNLELSKPNACVVCIVPSANLAVVLTLGSFF